MTEDSRHPAEGLDLRNGGTGDLFQPNLRHPAGGSALSFRATFAVSPFDASFLCLLPVPFSFRFDAERDGRRFGQSSMV